MKVQRTSLKLKEEEFRSFGRVGRNLKRVEELISVKKVDSGILQEVTSESISSSDSFNNDNEKVDLCIKLDYQGNLNKKVFIDYLVLLVNFSIIVQNTEQQLSQLKKPLAISQASKRLQKIKVFIKTAKDCQYSNIARVQSY